MACRAAKASLAHWPSNRPQGPVRVAQSGFGRSYDNGSAFNDQGCCVRAIQITEFGGPEVLTPTDLPELHVSDGMLLVDVAAAGVNFADTHQSENSYLARQELPLVPGSEVVGTTADGRRVCGIVGTGGYAQQALLDPAMAFDVPDGVSDGAAVALLVQGLTAWHLLRTSARMFEGESVVVYAAAGGVGTLVVQLARRWGAGAVIGGASTEAKRALATELGATATFDSRADDVNDAIRTAAGGKVDIVLDMVGGATTDGSMKALAPYGRLVHFGMASRHAPSKIAPGALMARSQGIIGFWLAHAMNDPAGMLAPQMAELLQLVDDGDLQVITHEPYPLEEARRAHEDVRAGRTTGKVVLDCRA